MTDRRVCFIVHEGRRSGPPIYALGVVAWLASHTDLDLGVVLVDGGPLEAEFAAICPTRVWGTEPAAATALIDDADLVYVNTAISIQVLRETGLRPPLVLTHVHELEVGLRYWLPEDDHELLLALTDRFLVGPDVAADNLVRNHGVPRDRIGQVAYFVPPRDGDPDAAGVRAPLGVSDETVLVGNCGVREWRKAPDLFAQLAWTTRQQAPAADIRFVWVGSPIPGAPHWDQDADLALLDLGAHLQYVENQADPDPWLAALDLYALTSREDDFPLACLAACSFGVPTLAFDGGGIAELLRASDGGRVVAYPAVEAMAAEVVALAADEAERRRMGARLVTHVERHHQLDTCARQVADEILALVR
jgi:hypothetical protein